MKDEMSMKEKEKIKIENTRRRRMQVEHLGFSYQVLRQYSIQAVVILLLLYSYTVDGARSSRGNAVDMYTLYRQPYSSR